ncbi:autotransporter-associated beta strand repeat-containing protein [Palleronia marisminoris]|uniref:Autotransporter-associated beta strand repeat protein n=1 Tax=Palleronia marisminoris TaxID=315423 RepID=A0A1Y5TK73_9RHOB|nr:autotransporter-associated beta strand repeat-containing protein [Palleronia marisminoris]SFH41749.1 autotransporter-associated beta strand repeat-containing protein [Palleronia marisminoris]SLN65855.1 Autotransporter-associated beta strand repeat protein [Palleronia marisminoris]
MKSYRSILSTTALVGTLVGAAPATIASPVHSIVEDGGGRAGHAIQGIATFGTSDAQTTFTNFFTEGGAGSGGGAGLGGVFFIDSNASLTLQNIDLRGNVTKGGQGGSRPPVDLSGSTLLLTDLTADISAVQAINPQPILTRVGSTYFVAGVTLANQNPAIRSGVSAGLDGVNGTVDIESVDGTEVTFATNVEIRTESITKASTTAVIPGATTLPIDTLTGSNENLRIGASVFGTGIDDDTRITGVNYGGADGREVVSIVIDKPTTSATSGFDAVNVGTLTAPQFARVGADEIRILSSGNTLKVGMTLAGEGIAAGTTVTAIDEDGTVRFSQPLPAGLQEFKGLIEAGQVGSNIINLPAPTTRVSVGTIVTGAGIPAGTTVTSIEGNSIKLSNALTAVPETIRTTPILSQAASGGQTRLRLPAHLTGIAAGMEVSGTGIPAGTRVVSYSSATGIAVLDHAVTEALSDVRFVSPLQDGGAMNGGIVSASGSGSDGGSGVNANSASAFIFSGEGQAGRNGGSGGAATQGTGGDGGSGGDGSNGAPVNKELIFDIATTTASAVADTASAAAALTSFPTDVGESIVSAANAAITWIQVADLGIRLGVWQSDQAKGRVGLGGDGGTGGAGGAGSEFFGGGAGGDGGDGGDGGNSITDGGTGGNGGNGGRGGFGAGGGSGGTGGSAGSTGNGIDGSSGAGGAAGFGGGVGSDGAGFGGGGGSGYGGAIFVRSGGSLVVSGNSTFANNAALAGSSSNAGQAGNAAGSDIFMMRGSDVLLAPGAGNRIRIEGTIADDSTASISSMSNASGDGASLRIGGGGTVELLGENTYTGTTNIEGAALAAKDGIGIHSRSHLQFDGGGALSDLAESNAGVLLTDGQFVRRVGTLSTQASWSGSGGFAASEEGLTLNFGYLGGASGQTLSLGQGGFVGGDSVLVFGARDATGTVRLVNKIVLNGGKMNVAVHDNEAVDTDRAVVTGNMTGGALEVGAAGYTGELVMTGTNALTGLTVNAGKLTTREGDVVGRLMASNGIATVDGGGLAFSAAEIFAALSVAARGEIVAADAMTVNQLTNQGLSTFFGILSAGAIHNLADGELRVKQVTSDSFVNEGLLLLAGDVTVGHGAPLTNDGTIAVADIRHIVADGLAGKGTLSVADEGALTLELSGVSTYEGSSSGAGEIAKAGTGTLTLTGDMGHTGATRVMNGTLVLDGGTLSDIATLAVEKDGQFILLTPETVGDLLSAGMIELHADLTTTGKMVNDGVLTFREPVTLTTAGLSGGDTGEVRIDAGTPLRLVQSKNTIYSGNFTGDGILTKAGSGTLSHDGAAGSFTADGILVEEGGMSFASAQAFDSLSVAAKGKVTSADALTVDTVTNEGISAFGGHLFAGSIHNLTGGEMRVDAVTADAFENAGLLLLAGDVTMNHGASMQNEGKIGVADARRIIAAGLSGEGSLELSEAGILALDLSGASSFAGSSAGGGRIIKEGTGQLTLTGEMLHSGGTRVTNGTLVLDDGNLSDVGTLVVDKNGRFVLLTDESVGELRNSGKVELVANLTAAGKVVNDGSLTFEDRVTLTTAGLSGGATGAITIDAEESLRLVQTGTSTYSGTIGGAGVLTKAGTGTLGLDGAEGSFSVGTLYIDAGRVTFASPYVAAQTVGVDIRSNGTLQLANGNQRITRLVGAGTLALGTNDLYVSDGGEFSGVLTGTGSLRVVGGQFLVDSSLSSETNAFEVDGTSDILVAKGQKITFPKVNVTGGKLSVAGGLKTAELSVSKGGTLQLGTDENISVEAKTTTISGAGSSVRGNGRVSGKMTIGIGAFLRPGNSPGEIAVEDLVLAEGSTTELEYVSGTSHDVMRITGEFTIEPGARLDILATAGQSLAAGESVRFFDFTAGNLSGHFGEVASGFDGTSVLNLSTGSLVGLGGITIDELFEAAARTDNDRAILAAALVAGTDGVAQTYGGNLVPSLALAQTSANPAAANAAVLAMASPEVYTGVGEAASFGLRHALPGAALEAGSARFVLSGAEAETDQDRRFADYGLSANFAGGSVAFGTEIGILSGSLGKLDGEVSSDYLDAELDGLAAGIGFALPIGGVPGLTATARAGMASYDVSGERIALGGRTSIDGVDASSRLLGLGLAYQHQAGRNLFSATSELLRLSDDVDGFAEQGDALDALSVEGQDADRTYLDLGVAVRHAATPQVGLSASLDTSIRLSGDEREVLAGLAVEEARFGVGNGGLADQEFRVGLGADVQFGQHNSASASIKAGSASEVTYAVSLDFKF